MWGLGCQCIHEKAGIIIYLVGSLKRNDLVSVVTRRNFPCCDYQSFYYHPFHFAFSKHKTRLNFY